jgi:hypothetical protein
MLKKRKSVAPTLQADLEEKIDILIELRKNKTIDEKEFQKAFTIIKDDIRTFSMLGAITEHYVDYYGEYSPEGNQLNANTVEQNIKEIEQHYAEYTKKKNSGEISGDEYQYYGDLDSKYQETKKALDQVKEILPSLNELINDLEPKQYE